MTALSNKVEFLGAMGDGYCHIADEKGNVLVQFSHPGIRTLSNCSYRLENSKFILKMANGLVLIASELKYATAAFISSFH
eukprot:scaffold57104_cov52-Cyclotella_meneghiniana.AAC.2